MPFSTQLVGLIEIDHSIELEVFEADSNDSTAESTNSALPNRHRLLNAQRRCGTCIVSSDLKRLSADLQCELQELLARLLTVRQSK